MTRRRGGGARERRSSMCSAKTTPRDWFTRGRSAAAMRRGRRTGFSSSRKSWNDAARSAGAHDRRAAATCCEPREVSPREALEALQARIAEVDPQIGAYLSRDFDAALTASRGGRCRTLPLGGVPIAIKDVINVAGQPCTCASQILRNYSRAYDATVIAEVCGRRARFLLGRPTSMSSRWARRRRIRRPADAESVGSLARAGRFERRLGGGGGSR